MSSDESRTESVVEAANPEFPYVEAEIFIDPLCAWSWAMWPQWRRLVESQGDRLLWRCRLGGMIVDWQSFEDPVQAVSKPAQMGPLWLQVRHVTGIAIDGRVWAHDPPHSSIPPCLAAKAAGLQSSAAELHYLERLWSAAMTEGRNIGAKTSLSISRMNWHARNRTCSIPNASCSICAATKPSPPYGMTFRLCATPASADSLLSRFVVPTATKAAWSWATAPVKRCNKPSRRYSMKRSRLGVRLRCHRVVPAAT